MGNDFRFSEVERTAWHPAGSRDDQSGGFTLIETLVSMALLLALFAILFGTFVPQIHSGEIGRHIADVQREGVKAHERITRELRETNLNLVYNHTNPGAWTVTAISFPTARPNGYDPFATQPASPPVRDPLTNDVINVMVPNWQGYLIYFLDTNTGILYRRFFATAVAGRLATTDTEALNPNGREIVSGGIIALRVLSGDSTGITGLLPTTATPTRGPLSVIVIANRVYASNPTGVVTTVQQTGQTIPYGPGSNTMRIESSVNPLINFVVY